MASTAARRGQVANAVIGLTLALVAGAPLGCDPETDSGDSAAGSGGDGDDAPADDGVDDADDGGGDNADGGGGEDPMGAVSAHNAVRQSAQPTPQPALPPVVWDAQLADVARSWAEGCVFEHSSNEFGENIYVGSGTPSAGDAIQAWADEAAMYDYDSGACSGVCGHYTQIVWRDTARNGCGCADCDSVAGVSFSGRLWVCNYDPPGNFIGQPPY